MIGAVINQYSYLEILCWMTFGDDYNLLHNKITTKINFEMDQ